VAGPNATRRLVVVDPRRLGFLPRLPVRPGRGTVDADDLVVRLRDLRQAGGTDTLILVLRCRRLSLAGAADIADQLARCRAAGVVVLAYTEPLTLATLLAISAGAVRWAPPLAGPLEMGLSRTHVQIGALVERIGSPILVYATGARKAAAYLRGRDGLPETVIADEGRAYGRIVRCALDALTAALDGRADPTRVAGQTGLSALEAVDAGLLTGVGYLPEFDAAIAPRTGAAGRTAGPRDRRRGTPPRRRRPIVRPSLAVVDLRGPLIEPLGVPRRVAASLLEAARDRRVDGIVLRIHSTGGDVAAADRLWALVRALARRRPIVAYLTMATSAAYHLASAATAIVANPCAPLGELGTIAFQFDPNPLLRRLGIDLSTRFYRPVAADGPLEPACPDRCERLRKRAELAQTLAIHRIATGRKLPPASVEPVADGRLLSAEGALAEGLIDRVGTFEDAIALAAERACITEPYVVRRV
jgi:protease-4